MKKELKLAIVSLALALAGLAAGKIAYLPSHWLSQPLKLGRQALGLSRSGDNLVVWRQQCQLELARLAAENYQQRRLLDTGPAKKLSFSPAPVIGQREGFLVLGLGKDQKLRKGQLVVDSRGLVGKISWVGDYRAEVQTVENNSLRLAVAIWSLGKGNLPGDLVAKGLLRGGRQPEVAEVSNDAAAEEGDLVAPLGLGGQFLIGEVEAISPAEGAFRRLRLKPISHQHLLTVFIVNNI